MHISKIAAFALLCLTLAAGTAWAYSASVHIYVTNDDNMTHSVVITSSTDTSDQYVTLDSGDEYEYEDSDTAWFEEWVTYDYDVYVSAGDTSGYKCTTSINVETVWDWGVKVEECVATAAETTACTIEAESYGTTCQITVTINE